MEERRALLQAELGPGFGIRLEFGLSIERRIPIGQALGTLDELSPVVVIALANLIGPPLGEAPIDQHVMLEVNHSDALGVIVFLDRGSRGIGLPDRLAGPVDDDDPAAIDEGMNQLGLDEVARGQERTGPHLLGQAHIDRDEDRLSGTAVLKACFKDVGNLAIVLHLAPPCLARARAGIVTRDRR